MASTGHVVDRVTEIAPPPQPTVLQVREVTHSFGERTALDGVSFAVLPGVLTGLLGPNGAGKTTVMRIMLGVLMPQRGRSGTAGGRRAMGPVAWGYMPQERGLYPGMPAGDQVVYFGRLHGLSRRDAQHKARALLDEFGIAERWDERTDALSGGLQQRLQLATALVHDPDVIVLDEPAGEWGAGDGNRTRMTSLEGWGSAIELHPQRRSEHPSRVVRP